MDALTPRSTAVASALSPAELLYGDFLAEHAAADLDQLAQPWALRKDGRVLVEPPRRILLRQMMMSHLVHHRAQLGVYHRLLGVAAPGAYGPSADD
jgi:uncharacterized damage-inducible protein DinB